MESVAREAGVSASTVSRALRSDPRISPLTRKKVEEVVARMGYRPNPLVSALMTQLRDGHPPEAKCNLGWLDFFKDPEEWNRDPVHRAFYTGAQQRATALGYALSRIPSTGRTSDRLTRVLRNRGISGLLVPNFENARSLASCIPLPLDQFTIVGVGTRFEQPFLHYSSDDQYECSRLAVQQLWALGFRRIGYVGEARIEAIVNGRFLAGYNTTLQTELGSTALPPLLDSHESSIMGWLKSTRAEVIVTVSRHVLRLLRDNRLRVPEDISLAHLNVDVATEDGAIRPGDIAGVRQDNQIVGANAVELLVSLLYHNERGVPLHPRGMQVQGAWINGATVRPRR